jgi:hypothetical protein
MSALLEFNVGDYRRYRHHHPVSAFPFCAVERRIGGFKQFLGGVAVLRKFCHTNRHCDHSERLSLMHHRQLTQSGANALGARLSYFQVRDREDDDELLAAEAADNVLGANTFQQERSTFA